VQPRAKIACWPLQHLRYRLYVMQQVKVHSCTAVKAIYASVSPLLNGCPVFETLFQSVRR
jgi:hypothetical protein